MPQDFVRQVPVHWNDCDPARIVFHANFVRWMDEGFHALCHARGLDLARMVAEDPGFRSSPLVNVACAFRSPAVYNDLLEHRVHPPDFAGGKSFTVKHSFWNDGMLVAEGEQVRIWARVDETGRLRANPVPADVQSALRG